MTAPTGVAARNVDGGAAIHSRVRPPMGRHPRREAIELKDNGKTLAGLAGLWDNTDYLIFST